MAIRQTHLSYYSPAMMVVGASVALITILATLVDRGSGLRPAAARGGRRFASCLRV